MRNFTGAGGSFASALLAQIHNFWRIMKKIFVLASVLLLSTTALFAQTALTNAAIVKLSKAGLSDDVIVATITSSPGNFDVTPDGLVALKKAAVSDKVIAAVVQKNSVAAAPAQTPVAQAADTSAAPAPAPVGPPRVLLNAQNAANTWGASFHNQAAEMSKDFGEECPAVRVTVNEQAADYTVSLNHVEAGFYRDNQLQASDRDGDVIAPPVKYESIAKGVRRACDAISADWAGKHPQPAQ